MPKTTPHGHIHYVSNSLKSKHYIKTIIISYVLAVAKYNNLITVLSASYYIINIKQYNHQDKVCIQSHIDEHIHIHTPYIVKQENLAARNSFPCIASNSDSFLETHVHTHTHTQ